MNPPIIRAEKLETWPPPLPPKYKGYRQIYGFHVDEKKMTEFAAANFPKVLPRGFWMILAWFAQRLRFHAQYAHVRLKGAAADDVDVPPGAEVVVGPTGIRQFMVLTVTSWERRAWDARPTVEQFEIMKEITGVEAGWYIDVDTYGLIRQE